MDKRLSIGINASILLILIIFCALLSLPLKYLFNTNYKGIESTELNSQNPQLSIMKEDIILEVNNFRKMKVCPFNYETWMKSLFITNYDKNCTEEPPIKDELQVSPEEEETETNQTFKNKNQKTHENLSTLSVTKKRINNVQTTANKSIPVAIHILGIMLVVSVILALAEVIRIRFARDKDLSTTGNVTIRRGSIINLMAQKKEMLKSQRSLDLQAMHRSTRLLGKTSFVRRLSFPIQDITKIIHTSNDLDSEDFTSGRHTHLIRRQ